MERISELEPETLSKMILTKNTTCSSTKDKKDSHQRDSAVRSLHQDEYPCVINICSSCPVEPEEASGVFLIGSQLAR